MRSISIPVAATRPDRSGAVRTADSGVPSEIPYVTLSDFRLFLRTSNAVQCTLIHVGGEFTTLAQTY